jgi:succinate dehydrogenase / fumarate reductase flavoprotein subunit
VFLDIASRRSADAIIRKLPGMHHQFKELADVDITKEPMEVGPTCHYMMGGVRVHPETQESTVAGLFAAGEVAGGMHGANRLGGNSLSDLLVFGKRAGEFSAKHAHGRNSLGTIPDGEVETAARECLAPFDADAGENPYAVHEELRGAMQQGVGIVRTKEDLNAALEHLQEFRTRAGRVKVGGNIQFNPGWHLAMDLENMIDISEVVARAALRRTESRGGHTREDYPDSEDEWGARNLIVSRSADGVIEVNDETLPPIPTELSDLLKD